MAKPPYNTPGVYVEEISTLPPSVAEVATAVPAFIGYTQKGPPDSAAPQIERRVATMLEYETAFGGPQPWCFTVTEAADATAPQQVEAVQVGPTDKPFSLHYALTLYFRNGGGPCYVVSIGNYESAPDKYRERFLKGLEALEKEDEPTLIVLTDAAALLRPSDYYDVCNQALMQCNTLQDRFTIIDVAQPKPPSPTAPAPKSQAPPKDWEVLRQANLNLDYLMYGAAYYPYLRTSINYAYNEGDVTITRQSGGGNVTGGAKVTGSPNVTGGGNVDGSMNFGDPEGQGLRVSFSGPADSTPKVAMKAGTKTEKLEFEVTGTVLTVTNAIDKTAKELFTAWEKWKADKTHDAGGFDMKVSGDGSAVVTTKDIPETPIPVTQSTPAAATPAATTRTTDAKLAAIKTNETSLYNQAKAALADQYITLPPSAAVAGIYARVDREQGVWKAPANVGVLGVLGPVTKITTAEQERLNVDATAGKSINAIRDFNGRGTLVWGARTLKGNDNEWRYVSVRRLFITIEESTKKASAFAVFEPNDQATWLKVKAMIESYLYGLWQQGALAGSKPELAYYVRVGLGRTMTPQDVLEGRMKVEIGIAAVRPAEFIVLRFSHMLQSA